MRQLHYGGNYLLVDTDVCTAIFNYARALADANRTEVVQIPILFEDKRAFSNMLLGPASQLFCTPAPDSDVDLTDDHLVVDLQQRTRALGPTKATALQPSSISEQHFYDIGEDLLPAAPSRR